ncbi:hypothetical protein WJU23_06465 [Prosthecobacter sp. SYSU 5D2]|uniref:pectate lyase family protein n=1 Tax=Prosthecobacter sp. SYSU 5D2 TaxID=3134134 RepID=UPI0031FE56DD
MRLWFYCFMMAGLLEAEVPGTPAFPGAEGAGKWAKGGRGGIVIPVTNLEDDGPGSLRAAVERKEPRTVIFRVSGTIELKTPLRIRHPFITIAGQTAPGDGICLKGQEFQIGPTYDVIVRHLRCRPGDKTSGAGEMDAISLYSVRDVIMDHCSATWSTDECFSITRNSDRVTVQHCLIAEALTSHALGSIIGAYEGRISFLNNLYASNRARNPRVSGYQAEAGREESRGPQVDFRHNVIFNWYSGAGYTGTGKVTERERIAMNYVGNYLKPGADTLASSRGKAFTISQGATAELYMEGNRLDKPQQVLTTQADLLRVNPGSTLILRDTPLDFESLPESPDAGVTYERVLENAGAVKPQRDAVDERIIAGVRDGTGRQRVTVEEDVWPLLNGGDPLPDQDGDGLPDAWERAHGLDERDARDGAKVAGPEGWTHLEVWLNSL